MKTNKPTAHITINKSRLKQYEKNSNIPVYYLTKSSEFQIELFNPTKETICAKISLNGKPIAQGGLVLKPAQRVFLDRYIDVARKFKFDTYEVANTSESRKAIEDNGDFRVEFYKEVPYMPVCRRPYWDYYNGLITTNPTNIGTTSNYNTTCFAGGASTSTTYLTGSLDFMDQSLSLQRDVLRSAEPKKEVISKRRVRKSIETGRVEQGGRSDQSLETVYMNWESHPFHTIEYKLLPVSQKVNTVANITTKRYCTSCGAKNKPTFKFCPSCGTRV